MMGLRDIPAPKRRHVRELQRLNPWWNLKIVAFIALWAAAGWVALHGAPLLVRLACYFVIGATIQGLGILMHEGVHRILFRNRFLNRWVAFVCGLPAFLAVTAYRVGHLPHHRYERGPGDPDEMENFSRDPRVVAVLLCLTLAFGDLYGLYRMGPWNAWRGRGRERRDVLVEYGLVLAVFVTAFALVPLGTLLHVWLLPALVARQLTNVRTVAEHALTAHGNRFTTTRTVASNRFVSFFMCNLNYHIVHHLYPGVPWYNLPALHRLLAEEQHTAGAQIYPSYTRFLVDLARFLARAFSLGGARVPLTLSHPA